MEPHIVILDGQNLFHRARSGFQAGDWPVVFNFFRGLRALVEQLKPTRVYLTLEGHPTFRYDLLPEYKANRVVADDDPKRLELVNFFRQVDEIKKILSYFPISIVQHPEFEADDVIYTLVHNAAKTVPHTVVSSDSDFTQLLDQFPNVRVYNPISKRYLTPTDGYDYVTWKALRGDPTDNVPRVNGCTEAIALELANDIDKLAVFLRDDPDRAMQFNRNVKLISLAEITGQDVTKLNSSWLLLFPDWKRVKESFQSMEFNSIVKDEAWNKFTGTFEHLWGPYHEKATL